MQHSLSYYRGRLELIRFCLNVFFSLEDVHSAGQNDFAQHGAAFLVDFFLRFLTETVACDFDHVPIGSLRSF